MNLIKNKLWIFVIIVLFAVGGYFYGYLTDKKEKIDDSDLKVNYNYAYFLDKDFFDNVFAQNFKNKEKEKIYGGIVSHHILAATKIAKFYDKISNSDPETIVIISPNHLDKGKWQITSSLNNWQTCYGVLETDKDFIQKLTKERDVFLDNELLNKEFGISAEVTFVKKSFPKSKIVPLIVKTTLSDKSSQNLGEYLFNNLPENSLVLSSVDFSHESNEEKAKIQDQKSIEILNKFDFKKLNAVTVDSVPAFKIIFTYLELKKATKFNLISNLNSNDFLDKKQIEVTSYIFGYFTK